MRYLLEWGLVDRDLFLAFATKFFKGAWFVVKVLSRKGIQLMVSDTRL